jgi:hypothetical protein
VSQRDPPSTPTVRSTSAMMPTGAWARVRRVTDRALADFETTSVAAVLHAACSSAGTIHRLPSSAALWVAFWSNRPIGHRVADPEDLGRWVWRLRQAMPSYSEVEDWVPLDPRRQVRVRHRGRLWRLHPGLLEQPGELFAILARRDHAVEQEALDRFGFTIGDLAEVALRIIDAEFRFGADLSVARPQDAETPPLLGVAEVHAASALLTAWQKSHAQPGLPEVLKQSAPSARPDPDEERREARLAAALEFATTDVNDIVPAPSRSSHLVPVLAVRAHGLTVPVPAGLILGGLDETCQRFVNLLLAQDENRPGPDRDAIIKRMVQASESILLQSVENLLAHCLAITLQPSGERCWLLCPSARHVIAISVVGGFSGPDTEHAVQRGRREVRKVLPRKRMRVEVQGRPSRVAPEAKHFPFDADAFGDAGGRLDADAVITRIVLVDGPIRQRRPTRQRTAVLTIDEWRYLTQQTSDAEELWAFLEELTLLPGVENLDAFAVRDVWAAFSEKGLLNPGADVVPVVIGPRDLDEDWQRAASLDPVGEMLFGWGMGGIDRWPSASIRKDKAVTLWSLTLFGLVLASPINRFAVAVFDADRSTDHAYAEVLTNAVFATLESLSQRAAPATSGAVGPEAVKFEAGRAAWAARGDGAVLVELRGASSSPDIVPARLIALFGGNRIIVAYDEAQLQFLPPHDVHTWMGGAVADGLFAMTVVASELPSEEGVQNREELALRHPEASEARAAFLDAWGALAPSFRVTKFNGISARPTNVYSGAQLTEPGEKRADRLIAREIRRSKIQPQSVEGPAAVELLAQICTAALGALHRELKAFDGAFALHTAADEAERFWEVRSLNERERAARFATAVEDDGGLAVRDGMATRAGDLLLESLLKESPKGRASLDHRDWSRLLHLAAANIDLSTKLSAARCGMMNLRLRVLPNGVFHLGWDDALMDIPQHQAERASANSRVMVSLMEDSLQPQGPGADEPFHSLRAMLEQESQRALTSRDAGRARLMIAVDDAMIASLGLNLDAVTAVLATAAAWPVPGDPESLAAIVTSDDLTASTAEWSGIKSDYVRAAIERLTLAPALLEAEGLRYWSMEDRDARLTIRPLIQIIDDPTGSAKIMILPRRAAAARGVYANYLSDARLPWIGKTVPDDLQRALSAWRQASNHDFEVEIDEIFRRNGFRHRCLNLQPIKARKKGLGIVGEIDMLAADRSRRIIWVVEAKNPQVPFDPSQLVHEVVDFHGVPDRLRSRITSRQAKSPEKSYVGKLLTKTDQIRAQIPSSLALLGLDDESFEGWRVEPIIVTPTASVAAAVHHPRVSFTTAAGLEALLVDQPTR